ncbi:hypothetical protein BX600DRAFT_163228 [Xylariales sp. PMI_506]|nr:hypothetical protein BX600DRAFT_163228 [Xylariales sp. PMI_506]
MFTANLPPEIFQQICVQCKVADVVALGSTCKALRDACKAQRMLQYIFHARLREVASPFTGDKNALVDFLRDYIDGLSLHSGDGGNEGYKTAMWASLARGAGRLRTAKEDLREAVARMRAFGDTHDLDECRQSVIQK